jgi:hypothetical protein
MLTIFLFSSLLGSSAVAGDVLLIETSQGADVSAMRAALETLAAFGSVDLWDSTASTPTLVDLLAYEGVMVMANDWHADGEALGDVLADYVDAGGNVVETQFHGSYLSRGESFGRLEGYLAIEGSDINPGAPSVLQWVLPGHPLAASVFATYIPTWVDRGGVLTPGATLVATHPGGAPAVATWRPSGAGWVTSLAFYPVDSDAFGGFGIDYELTDEEILYANALTGGLGYHAYSSGDCPGFATLSVINGTLNGPLAVITGTGPGSFVVPSGACAGAVLPITGVSLRARSFFSNGRNWSTYRNFASPALCGKPVVFLDLITCEFVMTRVP